MALSAHQDVWPQPGLASSFSCHSSSWLGLESRSKALFPRSGPRFISPSISFFTLWVPLFPASSNCKEGLGIFLWFHIVFGPVLSFSGSLAPASALFPCSWEIRRDFYTFWNLNLGPPCTSSVPLGKWIRLPEHSSLNHKMRSLCPSHSITATINGKM